MANAKKLPSGSWRVQVSAGKDRTGKRIVKSFTAPTKREAELAAAEWAAHRKDPLQISVTVSEAIDTYISGKTNVLSPATIRGYRMMERNSYALIGSLRLCDLNNQTVQEWISYLSRTAKPKTVKNAYSLFLSAVVYVDPSLHFHVTLPARPQAAVTVPTDEEVQRLIDAANRDLKIAICLAAFCTLRRGEICSLRYSDINHDQSFIHVHSDMVMDESGLWILKEVPKNQTSNRYIEIPRQLLDLIGKGESNERIVPVTPGTITNGFDRIRKRTDVLVRFHDLRHYSASIMHAIGVPDQYIMDRGGWKTDGTLKAIYRNVLEDKKNQFVDKTNQYFTDHFVVNE